MTRVQWFLIFKDTDKQNCPALFPSHPQFCARSDLFGDILFRSRDHGASARDSLMHCLKKMLSFPETRYGLHLDGRVFMSVPTNLAYHLRAKRF